MNYKKIIVLIFIWIQLVISLLFGKVNHITSQVPKVFFDCEQADFDYIREQISFVNYIIERQEADIYILGTRQRTASGGEKYTLHFIGRNRFKGKNDTLSFSIREDQTWDDMRNEMVKVLKIGLMQYIAKTPVRDDIEISYSKSKKPGVISDRWNNWVYKINTNGNINGEETSRDFGIGLRLSADRITREWKVESSINFNYNENYEKLEDSEIIATRKDLSSDLLIVRSLTEHFSVGTSGEFRSNTYSNIKYSIKGSPAIEWNIYPYSEANRRQFCFRYQIGLGYSNYRDTTIYNKIEETILNHRFVIDVEYKQIWGDIDINISGRNYFPDIKKYRFNLFSNISLHLFRGFSFSFMGGASLIHDQLSLPKGEVSDIERLLNIKELKTNYTYWFGIGIEYTFGSIYSNIVNPRF